jgi:hypothetical protein
MRSTFVGGVSLLVIIGGLAMLLAGGGGGFDFEYSLQVTGNSSAGYHIEGHPNAQKKYELDENHYTAFHFENKTGEDVIVRVVVTDESSSVGCPLTSTGCDELLPNVPNTTTRTAYIQPHPSLDDDLGDFKTYGFKFQVGKYPDGQMSDADPDLEIDREYFFLWLIAMLVAGVTALVNLLLNRR